jgi:hypothetical protein
MGGRGEGEIMAVLEGQDAIDFCEKLHREQDIKCPLVPTPKLEGLRLELLLAKGKISRPAFIVDPARACK